MATFDPDAYRKHLDETKAASQQALQAQADEQAKLTGPPGFWGGVDRFMGGVATGELDPLAGVGIDLRDKQGLAQSQTLPGEVGRVIGNVVNPTWEVLKPIQWAADVIKYGPAMLRGAAKLGASALQGGIAGGVMPGEDRTKQAGIGTGIGALLGIPGAGAAALGFKDVRDAVRTLESSSPLVKSIFDMARSMDVPSFNRAWYKNILDKIGGKVPNQAGREAMDDVGKQVSDAIDRATSGMSFDGQAVGPSGNPSIADLALQKSQSMKTLAANVPVASAYDRFITRVVEGPLRNNAGKFSSSELKTVTSNLSDQIRLLRQNPTTENRALANELDSFRLKLFDTAQGGDKKLWANARDAWRDFATARDASPNTPTGRFSPSDIREGMQARDPNAVPRNRARGQSIVDAADQALLFPGRAARNVMAGRTPVTDRFLPSAIPGLSGGAAENWGGRPTKQENQ